MKNGYVIGCVIILAGLQGCYKIPEPVMTVDKMGIEVTPAENREYSYTDKRSGFYYGRTHESHFGAWHAGWNIAQRRIVSDYDLYVDGVLLPRDSAAVTVYPHYLKRSFTHATEGFYMVDDRALLAVTLTDVAGDSISIALDTTLLSQPRYADGILWYVPRESPDSLLAVTSYREAQGRYEGGRLQYPVEGNGFLLAYGSEKECLDNIAAFREEGSSWLDARRTRMNGIVAYSNPMQSNSDTLDKAIAWLLLTTDQLVTRQQGRGIYAGLPWFNEYWGRDMFISMPGATLVNGEFDVTREILSDFSRLQDTAMASLTRGRIPNRANMDGILYNTVDGTPRFVMQVADYVRYSGDTAFIREIYPAVALSIQASIDHFIDKNGYLCHADADTWMDVVRNGIPGSPRGNRANDIQALWYNQLKDGAYMARYMGATEDAAAWEKRAEELRRKFAADFCDTTTYLVYDHLNADGSKDVQVRPNQLYTFELIDDTAFCMHVTRRVWEELVYPWGVGSLSQDDDNFHPQHENWHYYHKDDAYHNGTVWLWNNGEAMQRMIQFGQPDIAWQLFDNMNRQALQQGAVGSLSENADAHPREGAQWAGRSGTFLQAWSNAEQLRVWYQYFLGIRPDMINRTITINPQMPSAITSLTWSERIGSGCLIGAYERTDKETAYAYVLRDEDATVHLSIPLFAPVDVELKRGEMLLATVVGSQLTLQVKSSDGKDVLNVTSEQDRELVRRQQEYDSFFEGTTFCQPVHRDNLKAFDEYHEIPLTY